MKSISPLLLAVLVGVEFWIADLASPTHAENPKVALRETPQGHEVRYFSGTSQYRECLQGGRWQGCGWSGDEKAEFPKPGNSHAFELQVKTVPTPPTVPSKVLSDSWQWVDLVRTPTSNPGSAHVAVHLKHTSVPIDLRIHTYLDGTPVLLRWLEITNKSAEPLALVGCQPWCGRLWSKCGPVVLGHSLRWEFAWEGWFGWTPLKDGRNSFKQDRGLTWDDPFFVLRNDSQGEYFFGQLAWPASYVMEFLKDDGLAFRIGPFSANALRVLNPGETVTSPALHLGRIKGDFDAAVQAMHDHVRRSVLPRRDPEKAFRVQYLFPEDQPLTVYRGAAYNETHVRKCMDVAAAVGIEVFIVDGPTWCTAFGNWLSPDKNRFPQGLKPLVEYAHKKGMLFGLYAEPEGGREGYTSHQGATIGPWSQSQVFRKHPDWFVQPQSVLNLSKPEAAAFLEAEFSRIIEHYGLDLYRHDFNSPQRGEGSVTRRAGFLESDYWRHYEAFFRITERVRSRHPRLIMQQASGGGSRLELATLGRWHEHYTSDRASYPNVYRMAGGLSVYLPPEVLVTPNGMAGKGQDQPDPVTMLRGAYALGNTPMIFNALLPKSLEELKSAEREKFLHINKVYKTFIRPLLSTCKVYHHAPVNATEGVDAGNWLVLEFMAPDRLKGWATVVRLSERPTDTYHFKPKGLDPRRSYRVTFDNSGQTQIIEGAMLGRDGLVICPPANLRSELLLFEAQ